MNTSPLKQTLAYLCVFLMLFASIPLEAIADTARSVDHFRQGIFLYPSQADFGFGDLEIGQAYISSDSNVDTDLSQSTTPTVDTSLTPDITTSLSDDLPALNDKPSVPIIFLEGAADPFGEGRDTELREPYVTCPDEVDFELQGLGEPVEVGEFYKTYQVTDGSFRTVITTDPNLFKDSQGTTRTVDTDLVFIPRPFGQNFLTPTHKVIFQEPYIHKMPCSITPSLKISTFK